jgi:ComF family protein
MSVLEAGLGWLAPPQCVNCGAEGEALCKDCSTSEIVPFGAHCWLCNAVSEHSRTCEHCRRLGSPRFVWITTNYGGTARELVKTYKFAHQRIASVVMAKIMLTTLRQFNTLDELNQASYLVISIPTASQRIRERSFDHAGLLAQAIARRLPAEFCNGLGRLGQSRQVGALRSMRLTQAEGNYFVRRPARITGRNILLVDDVMTTGSTIGVATKALRAAGARQVDALVFAKRL